MVNCLQKELMRHVENVIMMFNNAINAVLTIVDQRNFYCNCYIKNVLSLRNDCSNNPNLSDHMCFLRENMAIAVYLKKKESIMFYS